MYPWLDFICFAAFKTSFQIQIHCVQVLLDTKEKTIQAMLNENRHNTNMLLAAAKTQEVRQTLFLSLPSFNNSMNLV